MLRDQVHYAVRDRVSGAIRDAIARSVKTDLDEVLRSRLGAAIRASVTEQKQLGGFSPELFADSVRGRLSGAIRERVSQELARTVFEAVKRDQEKRDQIARSALRTRPE